MCQNFQINVSNDVDQQKLMEILKTYGATVRTVDDLSLVSTEEQRKQTFAEIIKEYGMTDEQVEFYKKYSMERSRKAYERIAAKELGTDTLIDDWVYCGYYDAGYRGAEFCDAGHALRYVHIALNKKTGKKLKFGIKCVTDFFNLTPAQIKFIKNGFAEANDEIQQGIDRFVEYEGNWDLYEEKFQYKAKLDFILEKEPSALRLDTDELMHLLKLGELRCILDLKLFLPRVWENAIKYVYDVVKRNLFDKEAENSWNAVDGIDYIKLNHPNIYRIIKNIKSKDNQTDKQKYFVTKLLNTPWKMIDSILDNNSKYLSLMSSKELWIYDNLVDSYHKYGLTVKQIDLLKKITNKGN